MCRNTYMSGSKTNGENDDCVRGASRGQMRGTNWYKPVNLVVFAFAILLGYQNCSGPAFVGLSESNGTLGGDDLHVSYAQSSYTFLHSADFATDVPAAVLTASPEVSASGPFSWSIEPELPTGLSISSTTGVISGRAGFNFAKRTFTVTARSQGDGKVGTYEIDLTVGPKYRATSYSSREGAMSCAVVEPNRTVRCSGNFFFSLYPVPPARSFETVEIEGSAGAVKVSNAQYYGCAVMTDRKVKCWGSNNLGQLGSDQPALSLAALEVPGLTDVKDVVTGSYAACALKNDGTVWCWGDNSLGLVGVGTEARNYSSPQQVLGIADATQISLGAYHACAVLSSGEVVCWGDNGSGQLGHDLEPVSRSPVYVQGISGAVEVTTSSGTSFTCVRLDSGKVSCWGDNRYGQLGDGTTVNSPSPVEVLVLAGVRQISAGVYNSCARNALGKVFCWGAAGFAVGFGSTPVEIPVQDEIEFVQATNYGFMTVKDGSVNLYYGIKGELYGVWDF